MFKFLNCICVSFIWKTELNCRNSEVFQFFGTFEGNEPGWSVSGLAKLDFLFVWLVSFFCHSRKNTATCSYRPSHLHILHLQRETVPITYQKIPWRMTFLTSQEYCLRGFWCRVRTLNYILWKRASWLLKNVLYTPLVVLWILWRSFKNDIFKW